MGAEAHQIEEAVLRHAVDEHKVWLEVAIPVVAPFTTKGMIAIQGRERLVSGEKPDDGHEQIIQPIAVPSGLLPLIVALEAAGVPDFTH